MRTSWPVLAAACCFLMSACGAAESGPTGEEVDDTVIVTPGTSLQSCTPSHSRECTAWVDLGCTDYYPGTSICKRRLYERTCRDYTQTYDCRPYYGPLVVEQKLE